MAKKPLPPGNDAGPLRTFPGAAPADVPGQQQFVEVRCADLVLDPELQCRAAGLSPDVVDEYAAAMRDGAVFPPVNVRDVDGVLYLTDGWHREAATRKALKPSIGAIVVKGTRRDAMLDAARANPAHGLKRSNEDKRRAVRLLLLDPECAALSGRKLGDLVRVSHTYVDEVRKHYGLSPGMVLTPDHQRRTDGEATGAWLDLVAGQEKWIKAGVERTRRVATLDELAAARPSSMDKAGIEAKAVELRLQEFQTEPWPWPEDVTNAQRAERVATLDTAEDVRRALASLDCPDAAELLYILVREPTLKVDSWQREDWPALAERWARRPALVDKIQDVTKARDAVDAADVHLQARKITVLTDEAAQRAAFLAAPEAVQRACHPANLCRAVLMNEYRACLDAAPACPDPDCKGFVGGHAQYPRCVVCDRNPGQLDNAILGSLRTTAALLEYPDYGIAVAVDGRARIEGEDYAGVHVVRVDAGTTVLLALLQAEFLTGEPAWIGKVPAAVRSAFRAWNTRPLPAIVGERQHPKAGDGPTQEQLDTATKAGRECFADELDPDAYEAEFETEEDEEQVSQPPALGGRTCCEERAAMSAPAGVQ